MPTVAATPGEILVPHDTPLELATVTPLSSQDNVRGDTVELQVAEPLVIGGQLVLPKGARAMAQVTRADRKGAFGAAGSLAIDLLYVTIDGRPYRLRGSFDTRGKSAHTALMTSAYVVAFAAIITGKRAVVPAGTRLTGMFWRDVAIPVATLPAP